MKTIRHSFSKQPPRLPASRGGRTGSRTYRRRDSRVQIMAHDCEQALRSACNRPLGELTHKSTRTHWIIDEER